MRTARLRPVLLSLALMAFVPSLVLAAPARSAQGNNVPLPDGMKQYSSRYYLIYTDLPADQEREIALRMTKMAEEYHDRTAGFSGVIRTKFPFYVFKDPQDYYRAGGPAGSAGVFQYSGNSSRLMAIALDGARKPKSSGSSGSESNDGGTGAVTWHVIQHEGFHQFAHAVIGGELPIWVNEGLAEYFGEGLFTGDGFVTGIMPPDRLARVKGLLKAKRFKSIKKMMLLSHAQWNLEMDVTNYDQAWSMVQFLAHAENGKYQNAFASFMRDIGRNRPWEQAWLANFGPADGFEQKWSDWLLALPEDPSADLYAQATAGTLTSYLARAASQKQTFSSLDAFLAAGKADELKSSDADWLPTSLLHTALHAMRRDDTKWSLESDPSKKSDIVATLSDGTRIVGGYTLSGSHIGKVSVEVDDLIPIIAKAKTLVAEKKREQARDLVRDGIIKHPRSPTIAEARKLMVELR